MAAFLIVENNKMREDVASQLGTSPSSLTRIDCKVSHEICVRYYSLVLLPSTVRDLAERRIPKEKSALSVSFKMMETLPKTKKE